MADLNVHVVIRNLEREAEDFDKRADDAERSLETRFGLDRKRVMAKVEEYLTEARNRRTQIAQLRADHNL